MSVDLKFCGAAGTVTGSCYRIRHDGGQFLVDCGLFQGSKTLKALNYGPFPFDPAALDFVVLTHSHIDHAGLLPKLIKSGFRGPVYATPATRDLCSFMLPDSGFIQETEVEQLNRRNAQRGLAPVQPIYTRADAEAAMNSFRALDYETWGEPGAGVRLRLWNSGHILGAASAEVELATTDRQERRLRVLFSGDIGPEHKLFHPDPAAPGNWDTIVCEATYGDRERTDRTPEQRRGVLAGEVQAALAAGGMLLIPAFAVERSQELIFDLVRLMDTGCIPRVPIFLDSPLAIRATEVFARYAPMLEDLGGHADLFRHPSLHVTETVEASKAIDRFEGGGIVMAASGMCEAGRIRHHLKRYLWKENATVLLTGYQAPGTLGQLLEAGTEAVRIQGEPIRVRARIRRIEDYSGHADRSGLLAWLAARLPVKRAVYLTHGEESGLAGLREALIGQGAPTERIVVPQLDDEVDLLGERAGPRRRAAPRRISPETINRPDWHNELAQITLDLRARLDGAADERARKVILRRVRRALDGL
jgi:metallo-beta-lactamase family protein